ncbi:hypothetical protein [Cyclobacterium marinum]|uniref:hypothetical protein n=1 Tax=Cyclobacterium marinum TaxID=104 RepID=UPI0011EF228F|nr:hypothetical protein [Cyclobacterium marinum]MBI0399988.1 hypothetical protein [Cyclobacterium marinum]
MKLYHAIISLVFCLVTTNLWAQNTDTSQNIVNFKDTPKMTLIDDVLLSIGFNLNLIETTSQTSGLYYDINSFIPALHENTKLGRAFGLDLRFNQGTFIPKSYAPMERTSYIRTNEVNDNSLISLLRQDYIDNAAQVESYLILSISPTWELKKGFPIYLVGHVEFLRKTTDFITTTEITSEENFQIEPDRIGEFTLRNRRIMAGERTNTSNDHIFNRGIGLKLYKDINGVTVNLKVIFGEGTNPDSSIIATVNSGRKENGAFYLTHFEVIERDFGFKLGGEIRGLIRPKNYNELQPIQKRDFEPYSNIYIAKIFKFSKIIELLKL